MKLYEIEEAMLACVDPETGEVNVEQIAELEMLRESKIENIGLWIKQLKADADMLKAEEAALKERRQAKERKAESLTNFLSSYLQGQKFETPKCAISFRKTQKVEITDFTKIPDDYLRYKEPEANKSAIKSAIKDGISVPGAELVDSVSMSVK